MPKKPFDPSYSGEQLRQATLLFAAICSDAGPKERNRERKKRIKFEFLSDAARFFSENYNLRIFVMIIINGSTTIMLN